MVDIPLSDFRKMAIEEFDTSKLLKHAARQAAERGYDKFPIVDVDSHHYELESLDQILDYIDDPVLQQLARSATQSGGSKGTGVLPGLTLTPQCSEDLHLRPMLVLMPNRSG